MFLITNSVCHSCFESSHTKSLTSKKKHQSPFESTWAISLLSTRSSATVYIIIFPDARENATLGKLPENARKSPVHANSTIMGAPFWISDWNSRKWKCAFIIVVVGGGGFSERFSQENVINGEKFRGARRRAQRPCFIDWNTQGRGSLYACEGVALFFESSRVFFSNRGSVDGVWSEFGGFHLSRRVRLGWHVLFVIWKIYICRFAEIFSIFSGFF